MSFMTGHEVDVGVCDGHYAFACTKSFIPDERTSVVAKTDIMDVRLVHTQDWSQ